MKKRVFCNLLVLVLLLGMLPVTALAGGGSSVVWSEDFSDENCWDNWQFADVNHDGFSFVRVFDIVDDPCEMNYSALSAQGYGGQDGVGMDAEEYLISPVIDLQDVYEEYELSFDAAAVIPDTDDATPYTAFELYVIDPETDLSDQGLRNLPYRRFVRENPQKSYGTVTYRYDLTAFAGRRIRLVILHRDITPNQLRLDNFEIAEHEPDQHINRITAVNVPEPEIGRSVQEYSESDVRIIESDDLSLVPGSLKYQRIVHELGNEVTGEFEAAGEYIVQFELRPAEGTFTYSDAVASVNGRNARVILKDNGTPEDSSDDIIRIEYYFGYLMDLNKPIETASVTVIPPVAGKTADAEVIPNQDTFVTADAYWCEKYVDGSYGPPMTGTEQFEAGKTYRICFDLEALRGNYFEDVPEVRVNDSTDPCYGEGPGLYDEFSFFMNFETEDSDECTVRFCADTDDRPADISGRIGEEIGLPDLADQPGSVFAGWSYLRWGSSLDVLPASIRLTGSCTLYAIWQDIITDPEVGISTPANGLPRFTKVIIDRYARYACREIEPGEEVAWWTDPAKVGDLGIRCRDALAMGKTYYGQTTIEADENHCFSGNVPGLKLYGAQLDKAVADGRLLTISFHVTIPRFQPITSAEFFVDSLIPQAAVDETMLLPVTCLTPGLVIKVNPGLYESDLDAFLAQNPHVGYFERGKTYYASVILESDTGGELASDINLSVRGATVVSTEEIDEYSKKVVLAVKVMGAYDFEASVNSTDGKSGSGFIRTDFHPEWSLLIEGPYCRGGDHWIKAMPAPGYVFVKWQTKTGEELSTDNPYSFTLADNFYFEALFAPGHMVRFMNSQGEDVPSQAVEDGKCATEPKGLTAPDYTFRGWCTDPTCTQPYDFSTPVTSDLLLYSKWEYTPGTSVDKTELNKAISDAEAIDPDKYTTDSFAAVMLQLTQAKAVQSDPDAKQFEVDSAAKNLNTALSQLKPKSDDTPFRFDDVKDPAKFYFNPVYWAYEAEPQITNGLTATTFGPDASCTRGQVVTFLWRAAGCPEPTNAETPFKDLKPGGFYLKAVAWAVENEITNGMSPTSFAPDEKCNRGQIVTFLWRFRGKPEPANTETAFTDVAPDAFYAKAVAWAVEKEITNGMSPTSFAPDNFCTRGQVVTFLYRAMGG